VLSVKGWVIDHYRTGPWQRHVDVTGHRMDFYLFLYWWIIHVWYKGE
jgi:hypothetical protein